MNRGNQFLKSKELITNNCMEFIINFSDGRKVNLGELLMEFAEEYHKEKYEV